MLTPKQVSWKNRANAIAWCNLKKVKLIDYGAFDVHYQKSEQKGVIIKQAFGLHLEKGYEAYSTINWLEVFKDLQSANHRMVRTGYKPTKRAKTKRKQANRACL